MGGVGEGARPGAHSAARSLTYEDLVVLCIPRAGPRLSGPVPNRAVPKIGKIVRRQLGTSRFRRRLR